MLMELIALKELSPKWPVMCQFGHSAVLIVTVFVIVWCMQTDLSNNRGTCCNKTTEKLHFYYGIFSYTLYVRTDKVSSSPSKFVKIAVNFWTSNCSVLHTNFKKIVMKICVRRILSPTLTVLPFTPAASWAWFFLLCLHCFDWMCETLWLMGSVTSMSCCRLVC